MTMTILGLFGLSIFFVWLMKLTQTKSAADQQRPLSRSTKFTWTLARKLKTKSQEPASEKLADDSSYEQRERRYWHRRFF